MWRDFVYSGRSLYNTTLEIIIIIIKRTTWKIYLLPLNRSSQSRNTHSHHEQTHTIILRTYSNSTWMSRISYIETKIRRLISV